VTVTRSSPVSTTSAPGYSTSTASPSTVSPGVSTRTRLPSVDAYSVHSSTAAGEVFSQLVERFEQTLGKHPPVGVADFLADARHAPFRREGGNVDVGVDSHAHDDPRDAVRLALRLGENPASFFSSSPTTTSLGHLIRASTPTSRAARVTATAVASVNAGTWAAGTSGLRTRLSQMPPLGGTTPVESALPAGLFVGGDDHVAGALGGQFPGTTVRAVDGVVILHLERRVEAELDGFGAELGTASGTYPASSLATSKPASRLSRRVSTPPPARRPASRPVRAP